MKALQTIFLGMIVLILGVLLIGAMGDRADSKYQSCLDKNPGNAYQRARCDVYNGR